MEEWKKYKLQELCSIHRGSSPRPIQKFLSAKGQPWVKISDATADSSRYISKTKECIIPEGIKHSVIVEPGTLIVSNSATPGLPKIMKITACVHDGWLIIDNIKPIVLKEFLYYSFILIRRELSNQANGSVFQNLKTEIVKNFEINVPPISIQKRIVSILERIEDKIDINNGINDNLEQQAQAAFNNIIANTTSDKTVQLAEIAWLNPKRSISKGTIARSIEMAHLPTTGSFPSGWEMKEYNGGMKFQNGDTLMARITPCLENGKVAFINFLEGDEIAFGSTEYITMTPKRQFAPEVLYFLVRNAEFIDFAVKNMNGSSGRQRVSADTIGTYELPDITLEELHILETIAREALTKIKYNSLENMILAEMRDTLLPKLMSGELKINETDC